MENCWVMLFVYIMPPYIWKHHKNEEWSMHLTVRSCKGHAPNSSKWFRYSTPLTWGWYEKCSQTWPLAICMYILQRQQRPLTWRTERASNAFWTSSISKFLYWEVVLSLRWFTHPFANSFQLNLMSPVHTFHLGLLSYTNLMFGIWSHLNYLKRKAFWKKKFCNFFHAFWPGVLNPQAKSRPLP